MSATNSFAKPPMLKRIESYESLNEAITITHDTIIEHALEGWPIQLQDVYTSYLGIVLECNRRFTATFKVVVYSQADAEAVARYLTQTTIDELRRAA